MTGPADLLSLLAALSARSGPDVDVHVVDNTDEEDDDAIVSGLTNDQIAIRLEEYYAQVGAAEPERFRPGQLIYHKMPRLAAMRGVIDSAGNPTPHMFLEMLPEPLPALRFCNDPRVLTSPLCTYIYDCKIGAVMSTKPGDGRHEEAVGVFFGESRMWTANPR